jgi:pimeloyl-ACP methyl ester carboxylesterase
VTRRGLVLGLLLGTFVPFGGGAHGAPPALDRKRIEALAVRWFKARPRTCFEAWDPKTRAALLEEAKAVGEIPEGSLGEVRDLLWKVVEKHGPRAKGEEIDTPYGKATWIQKGKGGSRTGLVIGEHGGGEGAGSAGEAAGNWPVPGHLCMYPQGIRLVHDTWNTVHGERFVLTLIEIAKAQHGIDPDRVYVMGFSMGGTGSWFLAGRHPDLLAAAIPAHGVLMAQPKSQLESKEQITAFQHGFVPNVRNLPVYFYTGLADKNCMPGTFLYAWDLVEQLRKDDPGGYADVKFQAREGLAHAFPPGEPSAGIEWATKKRRVAFPEKLVWEHATEPFPLPDDQDKVSRLEKRWFYWLHCDRPADTMLATAVRKGNEFDLEVSVAFPGDFTIWMNPTMIDPTQDVVVRVDGKEVWRGRPVPDFASVLESLDARLDRTLVFDRRVKVPE